MAAGDTQITIAGNLVDDPELRFTPSGQPVAKFRVASTPRFRDNTTGEWKDGDSLFLTCNVWRQAAENVAESLTRGMRVIVSGRLRQRSYETKEGEKRTVYEVEVDDVGPSLRNASAKVNRVARSGAGDGGYGGGQRSSGGRSSGGQRDQAVQDALDVRGDLLASSAGGGGLSGGVRHVGQPVQVLPLGLVELERLGHRAEHLHAGVDRAALFQPRVPGDADPGQLGDLFAAQPGRAAAQPRGERQERPPRRGRCACGASRPPRP